MDKEYLTLKLSEIKPYPNNPRINDKAVGEVVKSIEQCEYIDPIEVDEDNVILSGHTRLKALKKLKRKSAEVIRITGLTDEQKRKYRILTNKTGEVAEWDIDKLEIELEGLDFDLDLGFEFEQPQETEEKEEDPRDPSCQHNVFENQELMQFEGVGFYQIPRMSSTQTVGDRFLRFMDWKEVEDPENYIAHFYYDDYKFIQAWREPDKYLERLRRFKAVISPDFSLYTDFPRCLQILSCYRRQWCGAYWQMQGIDVIPDVVWGDKASYKYCFDGIPKGGTVAVSAVGVTNDEDWNGKEGEMFRDGYNEMLKRLEPSTILYYGTMIDGLEGNIVRIPSYYEEKRKAF